MTEAIWIDGSALVLNAVVTWADGRSAAPPVGLLEGYFITAIRRTSFTDALYTFEPCEPYWSYEETSTYLFFMAFAWFADSSGGGPIDEIYLDRILQPYNSCGWGGGTSYETDTTNGDWVAQPDNWGLVFMNDPFSETGPDAWGGTVIYNQEWLQDGQLSFQAPWYYASNTSVLFTFSGVSYATTKALDLSQVTYRGQAPTNWDNGSGTVSYLIKVSPRVNYGISAGSFGWPPGYCEAGTYTNGDEYTDWEESFNWFWFADFGNSPVNLVVSPNPFNVCVRSPQEFQASGSPDGFTYRWAASLGATIIPFGDYTENATITFSSPGTATVTVYAANAGLTVLGKARCPVQTSASVLNTYCGPNQYGAVFNYCYDCAQGWYFTETVTPQQSGCYSHFPITTFFYPSPDGCVPDTVTDPGNPPSGPCTDVSYQVITAGPSKDLDTMCSYPRITQTLKVSNGTVTTTSSAGASTSCSF